MHQTSRLLINMTIKTVRKEENKKGAFEKKKRRILKIKKYLPFYLDARVLILKTTPCAIIEKKRGWDKNKTNLEKPTIGNAMSQRYDTDS